MSSKTIKQEKQQPDQDQFVNNEDFSDLLTEYEKDSQLLKQGAIVKGVIVGINDKGVAIDVGGKSIGYVQLSEFKLDGEIKEGDVVDVFLERIENKKGEMIISRDNARRCTNWNYLRQCMEDKIVVEGIILGKVKGGYAVDYNGINTFLPRSQVDTMLLTDDSFLIGKNEKFLVLKIDDVRGNIVVSRRAILEEARNKERDKVLEKIKVGDSLDGIVKNITSYGAFIDFGSFDGLLHLTDISWCKVRHPSEVLTIGQEVKVQVIKYDKEAKRVSLGMKQLQDNPWESIEKRYPVGSIVKGHVTNIANYGAFVEIENGIEGLVHISEMSWLKHNLAPNKILTAKQEVEVMILYIDSTNHRISLGIKQCNKNPWQTFSDSHKVGDIVEVAVKNSTEFGLFVGFKDGVDGLVHISDIGSQGDVAKLLKDFKKDDKIKVVILGTNYEKERISLGIKQLKNPNFKSDLKKININSVVSCTVLNVKKDFIEVELDAGLKAIIKRLDLSKNKPDQKTEKFEVGDRIEARVTLFNKITGKILLSIKDIETEEQESYIYSKSSNSGSSLGSILGDALQESRSTTKKKVEKSQKENKKEEDKKEEDKKEES